MLTVFDANNGPVFRRLMLGLSGGAVVLIVMSLAIFMICKAIKLFSKIRQCDEKGDE